MMKKLLSQEEIDVLLRGVEGGKVRTTPKPADSDGVLPYDFREQSRKTQDRMPTLELINDHFTRSFRNTLSSTLRRNVDFHPKGVEVKRFGEFIRPLPLPSGLYLFRMEPFRGHSLLVLESKLVFTLIDILFGGSGKTPSQIEGKEFTAIESRLIQKIAMIVFNDLEKAWNKVHPVKIHPVRMEINPQYVRIASPDDLALILPFEVNLEAFAGMMTLCIPYSTIEPIKGKLCSEYQNEQPEVDRGWGEKLFDCLKGAEVEVRVELGRCRIMVYELLRLKVGDVLPLEKDIMEPLVVSIQGVPKFLGKAGVYGNNQAVQLEGKIDSF
ncbi:MAG: flagellar motor switch protein FliM [Thermodesulfobacteriota bacterium]